MVKCGRCGKGSIRRGTYREESWVHVEEIFLSGVDKSRRRTLSRCREFEQSRAEAREKKAEQLRMRNS